MFRCTIFLKLTNFVLSILGDEQLASLPEFMDDSLINELLNGPIDSQSGWKTGK